MMGEKLNQSLLDARLAVCSWSLQPPSPSALCDSLESIGMRRVQLALSPIVRQPQTWGDVFDVLGQRRVEVVSGMMEPLGEDYSTLESIARTGGLRPDETWSENREHATRLTELAAAHGIAIITLHAGFMPEQRDHPERQRLLQRLQIIADLFGSHRIALGLETGQESAETLLNVLEDIARPNVCVNFDPANMILYGTGDPIDALRMLKSSVRQIHIKDALPPKQTGEWGAEVPIGEGAVDWPSFLRIAMAIDPRVDFVVEREAGENRLTDIRAARQRLFEWA